MRINIKTHPGNNEGEYPGKATESESVEHGPDHGEQVQHESKLDRGVQILTQYQAAQLTKISIHF